MKDGSMWNVDWPTEVGLYWFYGSALVRNRGEPASLSVVEVKIGSSGKVYHISRTHGCYIWKKRAIGVFQRIELPELP